MFMVALAVGTLAGSGILVLVPEVSERVQLWVWAQTERERDRETERQRERHREGEREGKREA